jgi:glyoxylase-like metal-dependent hydrolase (beta-lactamase superfamily II)
MEPIRIELPTGLGVGPVNAYLFTQPEVILVDAGIKSEECWTALSDALAGHGLNPADIARIVITHPHVDHYGLAARIVAESDATVWIAEPGAPWLLDSGNLWQERLDYYRHDFLSHIGLPAEMIDASLAGIQSLEKRADPLPADCIITFRTDDILQMGGLAWQVLPAPGHASMQTVFYQTETRQLISADMLLAVAPTPVVEQPPPGSKRRIPSLPQFLRSLEMLEVLDIEVVYPGHGRPFGDHRRVIRRQRQRIMDRKAECLTLVGNGQATLPELLDSMYAHQPSGSRTVGLWMLVGYLDLLIADKLVRQEEVGGIWHYRITGEPQ